MNSRSNYIDWFLCLVCLSLLAVGLLVIRSVAPDQLGFQIVYALIAAIVFGIISFIDYRIWVSLNIPIYIVSIIFLLTPFMFGTHTRGTLRWLQFGQVSIQPSELTKPFFVLTMAFLGAGQVKRRLLWTTGAFLLPATIVFIQPDLGTTLVYTVCFLTITAFNLPKKWLLSAFIVALLSLPLLWFSLRGYQRDRLVTFLDPYSDPLGNGYHVIQSVISVGSGRFFGKGLGQGTQSQLSFLPERQTDFVFASLAEELGLVGSSIILLLFAALLWRIYVVADGSRDLVGKIYSLGVLSMVAFQVFVNVGMNLGLVPVTGITLPFLSYGGSSLMSVAISLGLVHSIFRHNRV